MRTDFLKWLELRYAPKVAASRASNVSRIEQEYGDLETIYRDSGFSGVNDQLTYSSADERNNRPNPSKIRIDGNIRNGLATYKSSLVLYESFLRDKSREGS